MMSPTKTVLPATEAETTRDPEAPMTEEQAVELRALCEELNEPFDASLDEWQANRRIAALKEMKG